MSENKIDLPINDLEIVKNILKRHVTDYEVRVFGSRIHGNAKKFSDLDLVIMTTNPLSLKVLGDLAEDFSASNLPIKVDIVDWCRISDEFREVISQNYATLQSAG
jgi:predicted nucleotidyltransferase